MDRLQSLKKKYMEKRGERNSPRETTKSNKMSDYESESAGRSFGGKISNSGNGGNARRDSYNSGGDNRSFHGSQKSISNYGNVEEVNPPVSNNDDDGWEEESSPNPTSSYNDTGRNNDNGRGFNSARRGSRGGGGGGDRGSRGDYGDKRNNYNNDRGGGGRYDNRRGGDEGGSYNNVRNGDRYEKSDRGGGGRYDNGGSRGGGGGRYENGGSRGGGGDRYENGGGRGGGGGRYENGGGRGGRGGRYENGDSRGGRGRNENGDNGGGDRYDNDDNDGGRPRRDFNKNNDEGGEPQKPREFYIPPEPTTDEDTMFNSGISTGINFDKYNKIPIKVSGKDAPEKIDAFEESGLRDLVLTNVRKSGYTTPTPIQKTAIPVIMAGRDLMACAQTGSGKTAAFLLPIINTLLSDNSDLSVSKPHVVVVSPTRELSIQIYNEARKFAMGSYLKLAIVYGGTSSKHQSEKVAQGCHILICTPGRLLDFVDRNYISFEDTRFVVLDEADRMLDMGFVEPVRRIMNHETIRSSPDRQTLMFSATFPEDIQRLAGEFLNNYVFVAIGQVGGACTDVVQTIYEVRKVAKRTKLLDILNESADGVLVFVETKRSADFLASMLSESGFPTTSIHGDRLQSQREQALSDFKSGKMKVLIATSVAARGLDIKNIAHVVNYDLPNAIDDYVHRIGRTGRVGNNGRATSFFCPDTDMPIVTSLVRVLTDAGQDVPDFLRQFASAGGSMGTAARPASNNRFGGMDVRQNNNAGNNENNGPSNLEEEEEWN